MKTVLVQLYINGLWKTVFAGREAARPAAKAMYQWYRSHGYIAQIL